MCDYHLWSHSRVTWGCVLSWSRSVLAVPWEMFLSAHCLADLSRGFSWFILSFSWHPQMTAGGWVICSAYQLSAGRTASLPGQSHSCRVTLAWVYSGLTQSALQACGDPSPRAPMHSCHPKEKKLLLLGVISVHLAICSLPQLTPQCLGVLADPLLLKPGME